VRLDGKRAIVTGGTAGIGLATVRLFVELGARVLVVARRAEPGLALAGELGVEFLAADVADRRSPAMIVAAAQERLGGIDVLVNNAAADHTALLVEVPDDEIDHVLDVDLAAPIRLTRNVAAAMLAQGTGGSIVNLSSRTGTIGVLTMGVYGAAKGGLNAFTRHAAIELAASGIRVNAVAPGMTETPLIDEWLGQQPDPAAFRATVVARIPQQRIGTPEEVAWTIAWLASDVSPHVTGAVIPIDGGYTAQ
jgi:NAD(P)-dependent dehydrogenase (short-subunit alcohol dehydrogenase family)